MAHTYNLRSRNVPRNQIRKKDPVKRKIVNKKSPKKPDNLLRYRAVKIKSDGHCMFASIGKILDQRDGNFRSYSPRYLRHHMVRGMIAENTRRLSEDEWTTLMIAEEHDVKRWKETWYKMWMKEYNNTPSRKLFNFKREYMEGIRGNKWEDMKGTEGIFWGNGELVKIAQHAFRMGFRVVDGNKILLKEDESFQEFGILNFSNEHYEPLMDEYGNMIFRNADYQPRH